VLEGIGLIKKGGKNYIRWNGADAASRTKESLIGNNLPLKMSPK